MSVAYPQKRFKQTICMYMYTCVIHIERGGMGEERERREGIG